MANHTQRRWAVVAAIGGAALVAIAVPIRGQSKTAPAWAATLPDATVVKAFIAAQVQKNWTAPKTPWGDPDIQGNFTTKDEANTPFERPEKWKGRLIADITAEELAADIVDRQQRAVEFAPFFGGGEPEDGVAIAVPIHWFDNLMSKNSRPWFVIDPTDGAVPAQTPESKQRPGLIGLGGAPRGANAQTRLQGGPRNSYTDRYLGDRCIMWASGIPHSPTIYGNSFQILQTQGLRGVPHRDDPRGAQDPARRTAASEREHPQLHGRPARLLGRQHPGDRDDEPPQGGQLPRPGRQPAHYRAAHADRAGQGGVDHDVRRLHDLGAAVDLLDADDAGRLADIFEYACHEGNYGMANLLSAARVEERKAQPAKK